MPADAPGQPRQAIDHELAAVQAADAAGAETHEERAARRKRTRGRRRSKLWTYLGLIVGSVIVLFPVYVLVVDSLLQPAQLLANPPAFVPTHPAFSNFSNAITQYGFGHYLVNSAIQTGIIVIAQLVTSVLAAYAFVFLRFPLRRTLFLLILGTIMIPFEITATVNTTTVLDLGWEGNFLGLTAPFLATGFGIFLVRQAFLQIPKELREAAVIDGYGPMRFLWRIAIPLARPVIAALAVFSFLGAWNQYLWPAIIANFNPSIKTVSIGLAGLGGSTETAGISLAAAIISLAPLVLLLIFFRKNLIRSLTAGAVK
jgi:sn-glycerol 3-phosphate transport system permease protein